MADIVAIQPAETEDVAALLGRAFADNPPYRAIFAAMSDEERHRAVQLVKRGFTRAAVRCHVAEAIHRDGRIAAASLVLDPGQYPVSVRAKLWQASGCALRGPRAIRNLLAFDAFLAERHLDEPHFYLFVLGVEPELQGRGLGKALLRHLSARADAAALPCFLETDQESSVRLYESAGYRVIRDEVCSAVGGVRMWFMRRPPSAPA